MRYSVYAWVMALVFIAGCGNDRPSPASPPSASSAAPAGNSIAPAKLKLPEECTLVHKSAATGFQVYTCIADGEKFVWKNTPDAELADEKGVKEGKHFAGPTWELNDESKIVCKKVAGEPNPGACALLLLSVTDNSKKGALKDVIFVHRLETTGGVEPTEAPSKENVGKVVRVPYTATYYFYAKKN